MFIISTSLHKFRSLPGLSHTAIGVIAAVACMFAVTAANAHTPTSPIATAVVSTSAAHGKHHHRRSYRQHARHDSRHHSRGIHSRQWKVNHYEHGYSDGYYKGSDQGHYDGYRGRRFQDACAFRTRTRSLQYERGYENGYITGYQSGYSQGLRRRAYSHRLPYKRCR